MEINNIQPIFSICVPSFNRGLKALKMILTILPNMDNNWELLILDNASDNELESYQQIEILAQLDHRLRYVRHSTNLGFHGNFLAAFDHAKSAHIMLISDEDFANLAMIRKVLPNLHARPDLAVLRGGVLPLEGQYPRNSYNSADIIFSKGEEALLNYSLTYNYMSGIIFNREILLKNGLIELLRNGINSNSIYPHLYLELLACAMFDAATTSEISCFEGEEQHNMGNTPSNYSPPYSFGSRIDQFIALRDAIRQAIALMPEPFDNKLFIDMYLLLCEKYMRLITLVNYPLYVKHQLDLSLLQDSMLRIFGAAIYTYPDLEPFEDYTFTEIHKIYSRYKMP